ncbi:MAG: hypothetical protein JWQ21_275 [Herminiimonas sp.]|nr:hypothetical protein [Herminiimonas sp.]
MARIQQSIEVNVPLHAVYNQWTQFTEFPRFMEGVREVRQLDDAHLHWRADRNGQEVEWDSEITDQVPDQRIAWRDTSGPKHIGSLEFQPMQADKTRVQIIMEWEPANVSSDTADEQKTAHRVEQDLARFKKLLEAQGGESGAWRGEIHGSRPASPQGNIAGDASDGGIGKAVGQTGRERQDALQSGQPAAASGASATMSNTQQAHGGTGQGGGGQDARQAGSRIDIDNQESGAAPKSSGPQAWLPNLLQGWEEPMVMMRKMTDEMDQLFERFIGRPMSTRFGGQGGLAGKWMPPVEISQRDNRLVICADLPGIRKEDVQIEINNDKLTIEGERREENRQTAAQGYQRSERSYGRFYRMIPLPEGVDPNSVQASMRDGVLEITIPISAQTARRGKRIDIQPPP